MPLYPLVPEIWTAATLPTTGLYTGRLIFVTGLSANFNTQLLVYNGFFWRMATPRLYEHYLNAGADIATNNTNVSTAGLSIGTTPAGLEVSARVLTEGTYYSNGTPAHRWNLKNTWNAGTHYQGICTLGGTHRHHHQSLIIANIAPATALAWSYEMQSDTNANNGNWTAVGTFAEQWHMHAELF